MISKKIQALSTYSLVRVPILRSAWHEIAYGTEGVVDLLAERGHDSNYDDGDERENDRVLNQTLTFFLGCE